MESMIKHLAWALGCTALAAAAFGQPLEKEFADPPVDSRPRAFWCWLNGSMTKEQITRDLREMKAKGMSGAEIWDVSAHRNPDGFVPAGPPFLGDESRELIAHAIREGTQLDLRLGMVASSGWNAGGSWVPPHFAGKGLFWSQQSVKGPARVDLKLAFPECPDAPKGGNGLPLFHKEIAVLAVPVGGVLENISQTVDLTALMTPDSRLGWDAPPGEWAVLRFVCSNHGQQLIVPSPNSGGPMIDFFDPAATEFHVRHIADAILGKLGRKDFRGTAFRYLEFDSMELAEGVLWSDHFAKRFEEMRGYSPLPYLPLFAGWKLADDQDSRFHNDYKLSLSDQLIHSHYDTGSRIMAEYGLHLVAEAGGPGPPIWDSCPVDAIKALGAVDVPRGEFWMGFEREIFLVKEIASAAHVYGKPLVDAESFTTWRRWKDGPVTHKRLADRALCEGLNNFTLHTLASSPPEAGLPGRAYHAGTDINPTSTWWPKVKPFMDYMARCSHMLRQGRFVADVCYFYGAQAPNFYPPRMFVPNKIVPGELGLGYDYDVCDAHSLITRMSVRDGRIVLPAGMSYALLALRKQETMPLEVLRKIHQLVSDGAVLVGPPPAAMSGLKRPAQQLEEFSSLLQKVWGKCDGKEVTSHRLGKGVVHWGPSWRQVLEGMKVPPDFLVVDETERDNHDYIHRRLGDMDVYFVRNKTMEAKSLDCVFRAVGDEARLWDPVTGRISAAFSASAGEGGSKLRLDLPAAGSVFVVFKPAAGGSSPAQSPATQAKMNIPVAGPWSLAFPDGWGVKEGNRSIDQLASWTDSDEIAVKYFSGTATYTTTIDLPDEAVSSINELSIDLGGVKEVAGVFLNGKPLGIVWTPPCRLKLGDAVRPGKNELKVEVTNLWANRLIGDLTHPEQGTYTRTNMAQAFKAGDAPLPSGLLGPVRILVE